MIFVAMSAFSQDILKTPAPDLLGQNSLKPLSTTFLGKGSVQSSGGPQPFLSANYYASRLGFFCKQEIKWQKLTKIPFTFRLGSMEECDRMEGKKKLN